ncbi:MAG: DUF1549 domain-containing protein [Planctomycetia bacterium]|nr:DUF1549 domain-containing protein [Planctomycetia bacterium]
MPHLLGCLRLAAFPICFWVWACSLSQADAAEPLEVTPATVTLDRPESTLQLLATIRAADGRAVDVTRAAKYRIEGPGPAKVDALGLVEPVRDGKTTVVVEHAGRAVRIPVTVATVDHPVPISFPHDILPILTKTGCNTGGCHGKAEGQNGFKLSVFGFDPQGDHAALTMEGRGRRVFPSAPDESLLLRKATAEEPHGGGQRMEVDSLRYRRMKRWISEGAGYVIEGAPQVVRIEVEPAEQVLLARESRQVRVWAIDDKGARHCVTTEAEYESNATTIAGVDDRGLVQAADIPGEAAILARYLGHVTACRVTIPRPGVKFTRPPEVNFIDRLAWDKLERLGIEPSPLSDDAGFVRRVYLDVIGTLPTAAEARSFLADKAADKRAKLIDQLLARPEYADYWTMRFSDVLRVDQFKITPAGSVAITRWLHKQFSENRTYDSMVRELLTAKGNVKAEGPAAYYKALDTPELLARGVSQTFLGVRLECAQCHHHPSDKWGQDDYYAMAALFSGVTNKKLAGGGEAVVPGLAKEVKHPRTNAVIAPRTLGGEPVEFAPYEDRRAHLLRWMVADSNPYFSTMIANRLWSHYFGRGLVEQIDDLRATNPATNEPLLNELAKHMRASKYDLKAFTRTLLNSRLYQLSSEPTPSNIGDSQNFSHAAHKALSAEVLLDAFCETTGVAEEFQGWPLGTRAIQIWDNRLPLYFFRIFGRPVRVTVCECERSNEPSIAQALHLMNSPEMGAKIQDRSGRAAKLAASTLAVDVVIEELFLTALARLPRAEELTASRSAFSGDRRRGAEDVLWALLNSKEFLYNR